MSYASVPPPHSNEQLAAGIAAARDFERRHPTGRQVVERLHPGGWPRIYPGDGWRARLAEVWWVLTGRFSLHRAWQSGYDQHIQDESARRARGGR